MYIRKTKKTVKGKTYTNHLLVESVMTPKGPRQKTICSLGDLAPRSRKEWLLLTRKVEDALVGQLRMDEEDDPEVKEISEKVRARRKMEPKGETCDSAGTSEDEIVSVMTDRVETEKVREAGCVHVGLEFYNRLEFDEILRECGLSPRNRLLTSVMVMNRLIRPCSEYAMPAWIRRTALSDILGKEVDSITDRALYWNMDRLHPHKEKIERMLAEREETLFDLEETIYLYDLTSTYFEGTCPHNPKAKRGYSRDKRPDCKQVVVGLVVDQEGFPKVHEVFEGNRQDRASLEEMLEILERRVGKQKKALVVVDRGMAYDDNLAAIRARGHDYLVASRQSERDEWLAKFESEENWIEVHREPSPTNPAQKKTRVRIRRLERGEETLVLCLSDGRMEKDRAIRRKQENHLLADLEKLAARVAAGRLKDTRKVHEAIGRLKERYPRVARYYSISYEEQTRKVSWTENAEKKNRARTLDGSYLLKTNRANMGDEEIWHVYSLLTRAENAFRSMKSPLAERPIFHQVEPRVDTHIFLCVLAYHLLVAIEKTLLDQEIHTSWATVRDLLSTHHTITTVLPTAHGDILRIRKAATPEPELQELYRHLGVSPHLMKPVKTWSTSTI